MPQPPLVPRAGSTRARRLHRRSARALLLSALIAMAVVISGPAAAVPGARGLPSAGAARVPAEEVDLAGLGWVWPAGPFRLARPFIAPAHEYGAGHRGIDLDLLGGEALISPSAGLVAFSGSVAGRGILTIDHGDGLVTTLEPVTSELAPGTPVMRGEPVATLSAGGHAVAGTVHFGVRRDGRYINPLLLLGDIPRAVLLPCC